MVCCRKITNFSVNFANFVSENLPLFMQQTINRENNFDLIRLIAAVQVMFWHGADHFGLFPTLWDYLLPLHHIPGVPIFFTISGFLISHSVLSHRGNWWRYAKNRALRIYPALLNCLLITIGLLLIFGVISLQTLSSKEVTLWMAAQVSFFQYYTADSLRNWGTGTPNGSLWSIAVELQFYVFLPLFLRGFLIKIKKRWIQNLILFGLFLVAISFSYGLENQWIITKNSLFHKLLGNSVFHYLRFFFIGIAIYINFDFLRKLLEGKAIIWLVIYGFYGYFVNYDWKLYESVYSLTFFGILGTILLSFLTISMAFTVPKLSNRILGKNDISYGTYIYHMLVFNTVYSIYKTPTVPEYIFLNCIVLFIAWLSWKLIEKPALAFK